MTDVLPVLLRVNLALAIAVAGVMLLRLPARRLFGARIAYGLWILPPLAALAMLVPARVVTITVAATAAEAAPAALSAMATPESAPVDRGAHRRRVGRDHHGADPGRGLGGGLLGRGRGSRLGGGEHAQNKADRQGEIPPESRWRARRNGL